ncbi:MAG TPA: hypothetical protein PLG41_19375 [Leptospiraceae bacterium]|nr:hypothetical protein [Leptospiraceae bacterium]
MIVISDTSTLSNLHIIGKLDLLFSLYGKVIIPEAVFSELKELEKFYPELQKIELYNWIETRKGNDF